MLKTNLALIIAAATLFSTAQLSAQQDDAPAASRDDNQINQRSRDKQRSRRGSKQGQMQQRQRPNWQVLFSRFDQNQDGVITADEAPERMQRRLKQMDTDQSESISKKEFSAAIRRRLQSNKQNGMQMDRRNKNTGDAKQRAGKKGMAQDLTPEKMIARLDKNDDQMISLNEVPERMKDKFAKLDSDGDDQLDTRELVSMIERLKAQGGNKNRYSTDPEKTKGQMPKRPPRK